MFGKLQFQLRLFKLKIECKLEEITESNHSLQIEQNNIFFYVLTKDA